MLRILFFDDYPYASENRLFRIRLERELQGIAKLTVSEALAVSWFEREVRQTPYDVVILDVMARSPQPLTWVNSQDEVHETLTGVALLQRCRHGSYGDRYRTTAIYMRTARAEPYVQRLCTQLGATGFFQAGFDDTKLTEAIRIELTRLSTSAPGSV